LKLPLLSSCPVPPEKKTALNIEPRRGEQDERGKGPTRCQRTLVRGGHQPTEAIRAYRLESNSWDILKQQACTGWKVPRIHTQLNSRPAFTKDSWILTVRTYNSGMRCELRTPSYLPMFIDRSERSEKRVESPNVDRSFESMCFSNFQPHLLL
jgi:hypothetical protein